MDVLAWNLISWFKHLEVASVFIYAPLLRKMWINGLVQWPSKIPVKYQLEENTTQDMGTVRWDMLYALNM